MLPAYRPKAKSNSLPVGFRSTIVRRHRGNGQFQGKVYDCPRSYDHDLERSSPGMEQGNPAALGDSRVMRRSLLSSSFSQQERFAPITGGNDDAEIHSGRVIAESGPIGVYRTGISKQRDSKQPLGSTLLWLPLCALPSIALLPVCNSDTPAAVQLALAPALFELAGIP
jgi:hypothetical protein